jgi:hypothetical protein
MRACLAIATAVMVVLIASCGTSSSHTCVTVPQTIPSDRLLTSGTKLTVPVGAIVYVVLVEPESYASKPGFPWVTPTSSDRIVLAPVHLCKLTGASTLSRTVTGFRALHRGHATVTALLTPRWRSFRTKPQPTRDSVTVDARA